MTSARTKAAFLDRDGTINEEVDYLRDPGQLRLIPGAAEAIRRLRESGWLVIIITNQSGIARGLLSEARLGEVHDRLRELLWAENASLDAIYYCPHHPESGATPYRRECDCRKPKTGLIDRAVRDYGIDPAKSVVIGDRNQDIELAQAVGARGVLVLTGYGMTESKSTSVASNIRPHYTAADLLDAVNWVLLDHETN